MVANYVSYSHFPVNPVIRSDQGGSRNIVFCTNGNANTSSYVTFVSGEVQQFGAHKGRNQPKHYLCMWM